MDEGPRTGSWAPGRTTPTAVRPRLVPLPEPGTVLAERFVIEAVLGRGGTGVVYVARDRRLNQRVAIKLLHPDLVNDVSRERLRREVQAARHGHANVVTVFDLHNDGGPMPFLSMELVEGRSLAHILARERSRLGIEETIAIGRQIAAALDHLHAHGLVHRDVKPSNILVTADGTAKLCDLGLVRLLERGETLTATAMTVGTPAYMAPEQGSGGDLTPAADVYALGLTLYECLTGKVPHAGESAIDTLVRRQKARPPALRRDDPGCPRWLDRLLARMLEPRPADRPSAIAVARAIETRRVRRRISARATATVAAVIVLAAGGVLGWRALAARETVRVEVVGAEVHGVDARGDPTWRVALAGPADRVYRADLDGDGRDETLIAGENRAALKRELPGAARPRQEFLVVSRDGRVITSVDPAERIGAGWDHAFSPQFVMSAQTADIDLDGTREILLNCSHHVYYPNLLLVYWPASDVWDVLVNHTGRISAAAAVGDRTAPRVRLVGVNNRLGMLPIFAEVVVTPPRLRSGMNLEPSSTLQAPQYGSLRAAHSQWFDYVPLPELAASFQLPDALEAEPDGGVRLLGAAGRLDLDRFGNLRGGPNEGSDLRQTRLDLLAGIAGLRETDQQPSTPANARLAAARVRAAAAALLIEPQYRAIVDLAEARALSRAGDPVAGLGLLRETLRAVSYEDVAYRLAHLQALTGDLQTAAETLRSLIERPRGPRGGFDGPHLGARVAIEQRDRSTVEAMAERVGRAEASETKQGDIAAVFLARANLWWDEASAVDALVRSQLYTPDGDAIACLVRWRLRHTGPDDIESMRTFVANVPDAVPEGTLALAAAQVGAGSAVEAIGTLDRLIFATALDAREDFAMRQILDLAQGLRAKALLASGRPADARAAAAELLLRLTPGLLPAILCGEVIGAGGGAGGLT